MIHLVISKIYTVFPNPGTCSLVDTVLCNEDKVSCSMIQHHQLSYAATVLIVIRWQFIVTIMKMIILLTRCMLGNFSYFCWRLLTFLKFTFQNIFQDHFQSVKRFESRSRPTFCRSRYGSKLFAKKIQQMTKDTELTISLDMPDFEQPFNP